MITVSFVFILFALGIFLFLALITAIVVFIILKNK